MGCWTDQLSLGRAVYFQQELDGSTLTTELCLGTWYCHTTFFTWVGLIVRLLVRIKAILSQLQSIQASKSSPYPPTLSTSLADTLRSLFLFTLTNNLSRCYCGVVLGNGTSQVDDSFCQMPCNGNSSEMCGGAQHLNLYVADDLMEKQVSMTAHP